MDCSSDEMNQKLAEEAYAAMKQACVCAIFPLPRGCGTAHQRRKNFYGL